MTNATPPGWYPDPWNPSAQRFWDGGQWTEHAAAANGRSDRRRVPEGTPIYGPLIWVLALLPLLGAIVVWFEQIDTQGLVDYVQQIQQASDAGRATPPLAPTSVYGPGYWVGIALGWGGYAVSIVLAYFDYRRLERVGVERPFQWSWAFLTTGVYVIGRSVIVRRVASPRGLAPVWLLIGSYIAAIVSSSIWASILLNQLFQQLNGALPTA